MKSRTIRRRPASGFRSRTSTRSVFRPTIATRRAASRSATGTTRRAPYGAAPATRSSGRPAIRLRDNAEHAAQLAAGGPRDHSRPARQRSLADPARQRAAVRVLLRRLRREVRRPRESGSRRRCRDLAAVRSEGRFRLVRPRTLSASRATRRRLISRRARRPRTGRRPWAGRKDDFNLRLDKEAVPGSVRPRRPWVPLRLRRARDQYRPGPYVGPIVVNDKLLAAPAGAVMTFANVPPWLCLRFHPPSTSAIFGPTVLLPGDSVDLYVTVDLPAARPSATSTTWPASSGRAGFGDADPADDFDFATATVRRTARRRRREDEFEASGSIRLRTSARTNSASSSASISSWSATSGAAPTMASIKVDETVPAGTTATFPQPSWTCPGAGTGLYLRHGARHASAGSSGSALRGRQGSQEPCARPRLQGDEQGQDRRGGGRYGSEHRSHRRRSRGHDDPSGRGRGLPGAAALEQSQAQEDRTRMKNVPIDRQTTGSASSKSKCRTSATTTRVRSRSPMRCRSARLLAPRFRSRRPPDGPAEDRCCSRIFTSAAATIPTSPIWRSAEIIATVKVPVAPGVQCEVTNNAVITKAPGGTLLNSFAGDDTSSGHRCIRTRFPARRRPGHLPLACHGRARAAAQDARRQRDQPHDHESRRPKRGDARPDRTRRLPSRSRTRGRALTTVRSKSAIRLFDGATVEPSNGSWSAPWVCEGQSAVGHPEQGICTHPRCRTRSRRKRRSHP